MRLGKLVSHGVKCPVVSGECYMVQLDHSVIRVPLLSFTLFMLLPSTEAGLRAAYIPRHDSHPFFISEFSLFYSVRE